MTSKYSPNYNYNNDRLHTAAPTELQAEGPCPVAGVNMKCAVYGQQDMPRG
jgi:hypothetical protein